MHLKNIFFINSSIFLLVPSESPEGPPEVQDVRTFRGPSVDIPWTSGVGWVNLCFLQSFCNRSSSFSMSISNAEKARIFIHSPCFLEWLLLVREYPYNNLHKNSIHPSKGDTKSIFKVFYTKKYDLFIEISPGLRITNVINS